MYKKMIKNNSSNNNVIRTCIDDAFNILLLIVKWSLALRLIFSQLGIGISHFAYGPFLGVKAML